MNLITKIDEYKLQKNIHELLFLLCGVRQIRETQGKHENRREALKVVSNGGVVVFEKEGAFDCRLMHERN